jgi:hypothetical protein
MTVVASFSVLSVLSVRKLTSGRTSYLCLRRGTALTVIKSHLIDFKRFYFYFFPKLSSYLCIFTKLVGTKVGTTL